MLSLPVPLTAPASQRKAVLDASRISARKSRRSRKSEAVPAEPFCRLGRTGQPRQGGLLCRSRFNWHCGKPRLSTRLKNHPYIARWPWRSTQISDAWFLMVRSAGTEQAETAAGHFSPLKNTAFDLALALGRMACGLGNALDHAQRTKNQKLLRICIKTKQAMGLELVEDERQQPRFAVVGHDVGDGH